ncbi:MAG: SPOR domain-containing protein [Rhizobiaceae bacterium]
MAKSNHAENLSDAPKTEGDPISELSDIMKFDPVEAAIEKADAELQLDLENELLGDLSLIDEETPQVQEPGSTETQEADGATLQEAEGATLQEAESAAVENHKVPVPGIDDVPQAPDADAVEPELPVAAVEPEPVEPLDSTFDDVFSDALDDPDDEIPEQPSVPEELENQLNSLLAGLGAKETADEIPEPAEPAELAEPVDGSDEVPVAADEIQDFAGEVPDEVTPVEPDLPAVDADAAGSTESTTETASPTLDEEAAPIEEEDPVASLALDLKSLHAGLTSISDDEPAEPAPLVDTAEISDEAVPVEDDLEIPEVSFESDVPEPPHFEDLDEEFSKAFNKISEFDKVEDQPAASAIESPQPHLGEKLDDIFNEMNRNVAASPVDASAAGHAGHDVGGFDDGTNDHLDWEDQLDRSDDRQNTGLPPLPSLGTSEIPRHEEGGGARRGVLIAMIVAAIAVAGGIGAFAISFGGGSGEEAPAVVKADDTPVKVKPKDPGGKTVPNEDNKVYEQVAGTNADETPAQETLISTDEEPIDVTAENTASATGTNTPRIVLPDPVADPVEPEAAAAGEAENPLPTEKADDRILPEAETPPGTSAEELIAVKPRRVKTLVVKPDGTLVPREEPVAAEEVIGDVATELRAGTANEETNAAQAAETEPVASDNTGSATSDTASNGQTTEIAAVEPPKKPAEEVRQISEPAPNEETAAANTESSTADGETAVADEGVIVEGIPFPTPAPRAEYEAQVAAAAEARREAESRAQAETSETEVAAANPQPAANTEWWVQISSQPSRASAQASYADMAGRYGSIIGGRGVNIVRAEIEGKGTYYRVRIAGGSRNEAAQLCNRLKNAGANCFIAR